MFIKVQDDEKIQLSSLFIALLDKAPNKAVFLGEYHSRFRPNRWSGSRLDLLVQWRDATRQLGNHPDRDVRDWVIGMEAPVANWIEEERSLDRGYEESFE
jgi:hypothetical protein